MGFKGSGIIAFSLPNQCLSFPFFISLASWPHQPWLPCYCLTFSLHSSLPNLTSLSLIVSSPLFTSCQLLNDLFSSCTFHLLQFSAPALWNSEYSYLWLGNHSLLEEVGLLFMPQWLFVWPRAIRRERWEGTGRCQEASTLVFSSSKELKPPGEVRILFCLAVLHLDSTGDL